MRREQLTINDYFEWLYNIVCKGRFPPNRSRRKLLATLHDIEFKYSISLDGNRAEDGLDLRRRFARHYPYESYDDTMLYLDGPCSVLEMMVALAVRAEEQIMDDPSIGDRTGQWFWGMIVNLGLGSMHDDNFDRRLVDISIERLLNRDYEPNGKGGLFTVRHRNEDMRDVEIWYQLCWYLNEIT